MMETTNTQVAAPDATPPQTQTPAPGAQPQEPKPAETPSLADLIKADPEKTVAEIEKLRKENAEHRKAAKEAKEALEARQKAETEAEQKRLTEQGDFKKLYETSKAEIESLKTELTSLRRKVIAQEFGLPAEIAARLQGDNEEALRKDAEALRAILPAQQQTQSAGRSANTTTVPGGSPIAETDDQKRTRIWGSAPTIFTAQPLIHNTKGK